MCGIQREADAVLVQVQTHACDYKHDGCDIRFSLGGKINISSNAYLENVKIFERSGTRTRAFWKPTRSRYVPIFTRFLNKYFSFLRVSTLKMLKILISSIMELSRANHMQYLKNLAESGERKCFNTICVIKREG